jgi:hypothetical protein
MKAINKKLVVIESFPMPESGVLEMSEQTRESEMKKQNKGTVILSGSPDLFAQKGDVVSYFRAAATDITDEDGKVYQVVNDVHVLAKF